MVQGQLGPVMMVQGEQPATERRGLAGCGGARRPRPTWAAPI
jgi:hypothetical protein